MSLQMGMGMPYLVLEVNRDNIVQDTMRQVSALRQNDLRKPLKVKFRGEEGVDEGGVQKEFFQVRCPAILRARPVSERLSLQTHCTPLCAARW